MYYNCVKFHKNAIRSLVGVAFTRYKVHTPPPFRESISWIITPFKFWTASIFLHAHLQVVYYKCVKFHKNPISRLGGVALTRYMDGRTGWFLYTPQTLFAGGIITNLWIENDLFLAISNGSRYYFQTFLHCFFGILIPLINADSKSTGVPDIFLYTFSWDRFYCQI